ncbi:glycosyl hydrolase family 16 [Dokdonia sp. Hel_I_53]|nr:glycosyl hydrolase family 16 [Dokdonia sp. Hel_I_53]
MHIKLTRPLYLLVTILLIGSCDQKPDDTYGEVVIVDDVNDTDDNGNADETPDVSSFTGYNQPVEDVNGWELIFEDEFTANLDNWTIWTGGAYNNELQHYQPDNLILKEGVLFIREQRESVTGATTNVDSTQKNFNFTSGRIESNQNFSAGNTSNATKLRFSARILLPEGEGLWPAFWSYGDPWPTQGEFDILEFRGNNTTSYVTNFFYGTTAGVPSTDAGQTSFNVNLTSNITQNWHVFELIWSENTLEILFDNEVVHSFTEANWNVINDMYTKSQRLVLNMAVGGDFFQPNVDPTSIPNEAFTAIDWVRVYKQ